MSLYISKKTGAIKSYSRPNNKVKSRSGHPRWRLLNLSRKLDDEQCERVTRYMVTYLNVEPDEEDYSADPDPPKPRKRGRPKKVVEKKVVPEEEKPRKRGRPKKKK